jgi:hypothetical protein
MRVVHRHRVAPFLWRLGLARGDATPGFDAYLAA